MLDRFGFQRQRAQVAGKAKEEARKDRHVTREPRTQRVSGPRETC